MSYAKDWRGLSIRQPWAWLIVHGYKGIENRDWKHPPSYRGHLVIHAGKTFDMKGYKWVLENFPDIDMPGHPRFPLYQLQQEFDCGGFVGKAWLHDVVTKSDSNWFFGKYGFVLRRPAPFPRFKPYSGQLGLFKLPQSVVDRFPPILS